MLWSPKYEAALSDPNNGLSFRKLLFARAKRLREPLAMTSFMFFLQDMNKKQVINLQSDPDALEFSLDLAVSQRLPNQKGNAMAMVASSFKSDKLAFFEEKLLHDEAVIEPFVRFEPKGLAEVKVETRACDYALAVCVKLTGQSFQDYGFDILGPYNEAFSSWVNAGFSNDETRKAALRKYAEWRKANPITKDEPK
jgi:hypothetical protein